MCVYHCVVHNTAAQNSSHDCPSYPPKIKIYQMFYETAGIFFFKVFFEKLLCEHDFLSFEKSPQLHLQTGVPFLENATV